MKTKIPLALMALLIFSGCTKLDQARLAVDVGVETARRLDNEAIAQADIERKRARQLRCLSPFLTPDALATASADPRLGEPWVNELLRDCPQFSGFIANVVIQRAIAARLLPDQSGTK